MFIKGPTITADLLQSVQLILIRLNVVGAMGTADRIRVTEITEAG